MPAIGKQSYRPSPTFSESTAAIDPAFRAKVAADSIAPCRGNGLIAAGFLEDGQGFQATANSNGNFAYQRTTNFDYTCTVRTEDGRGSRSAAPEGCCRLQGRPGHPHRHAQGH